MATKKKTEVEAVEEVKEVEAVEAEALAEVAEEAPKKSTKKSSKKKAEPIEEKVDAAEEPVVEAKPVEEPKEAPAKVEEPKITIEAAPVEETKQPVTEKVADKKSTPIMAAPVASKTATPYSVTVTPKIGATVFKGPGFIYAKAGTRPCGTNLLIKDVCGNFGRIGTDKWISLGAVKKI